MDPVQALKNLLAMLEDEAPWDDITEQADALQEWLDMGGFAPADPEPLRALLSAIDCGYSTLEYHQELRATI